MSGADLVYWHRKREQWWMLAERAPDSATADYLHEVCEPTARAIAGLEKALGSFGRLLEEALSLDLRRRRTTSGESGARRSGRVNSRNSTRRARSHETSRHYGGDPKPPVGTSSRKRTSNHCRGSTSRSAGTKPKVADGGSGSPSNSTS